MDGSKIYVHKSGDCISIHFDGCENSETYLKLCIDDFTTVSGSNAPEKLRFTFKSHTDSDDFNTSLLYKTKYNLRYDSTKDFLINTGYSKKAKKSIEIVFPMAGTYTISDISVICQPMDGFSQKISRLRENPLEKVKIKTDEIRASVSFDEAKILCIGVPYSKGWSAYVDGEKTQLLRANTMFSALALDKGNHDIQLVYSTPYLKTGFCMTAAGFICLSIITILTQTKSKRNKHHFL